MAQDSFQYMGKSLESPADNAVAVTPSDGADLTNTSRALFIGTSGNITVYMKDQSTAVLFTNVPVGVLPIRVDRVLSTGTTASGIVALW